MNNLDSTTEMGRSRVNTRPTGKALLVKRAGFFALLAVAALIVAACSAPIVGGAPPAPTMTAIPLPTNTPVPLAQVQAAGVKHTVQYTPAELATILSQASSASGSRRFGGGQEQVQFQNGDVVIQSSFTNQSGQQLNVSETVQLTAQNGALQANVVSASNGGQAPAGTGAAQVTPNATRRPRAQGTPGAGGGFGGQQIGGRIASAITQALAASASNGSAASQATVYVDSVAIQNNTMTINYYTISPQGAGAAPGALPQTGSSAPGVAIPADTPAVTGTVTDTLPSVPTQPPLYAPSFPTPLPTPTLLPPLAPPATATPAPSAGTGASSSQPQATPAPTAAPAALSGKLVFETSSGGAIYTINADGTGLKRVASGMDPVWSPDGTQIAYTSAQDPRGVWVINADGSGAQRVFDWSEARWSTWVPMSDDPAAAVEILFSRQNGGSAGGSRCFRGNCFTIPAQPHWTLGLVNVSNGSFSDVIGTVGSKVASAPSWSSAAQRMVFEGGHGLVVQNLDSSGQYALTNDSTDTSPTWSPDGKQVSFMRRQNDHWEIYAVNVDGTNLRELTTTAALANGTAGNSVAPAWSPDGRYIAFLTDRTGAWQMWVMNADGSQQRPMFSGALNGVPLSYSFVADRAISWAR